jgi:Fe-S-cluster-containing dehydrogenase component
MEDVTGRLVVWRDRCRGCRSCQLACSLRRTGEFNPAASCIELDRDLVTERTAPMIRALSCDLCGGRPVCVQACTYSALMYEGISSKIEIRY